jgi:hypothetical protein
MAPRPRLLAAPSARFHSRDNRASSPGGKARRACRSSQALDQEGAELAEPLERSHRNAARYRALRTAASRCSQEPARRRDAPLRRPTRLAQWWSRGCEHAIREPPVAFAQPRDSAGGSRRRNELRPPARHGAPAIQARAKSRQGKGRTWPSSMEQRTRTFSLPPTASPPATTTSMEVTGTIRGLGTKSVAALTVC